ncbi:MAG TPA: hypothetical protein VK762_19465 [Polyangiaceae bacterium]|nr:hypothetical protein [Polyangiaceae bacterium]
MGDPSHNVADDGIPCSPTSVGAGGVCCAVGDYPSADATCQCSNYGCSVSAQQCFCGYGTVGPSNCGTHTYSTCCLGPASCLCNNFGAACESTETQVPSCPPANVCNAAQTPIATCRDTPGSTDGGRATDDGSDNASVDSAVGEASASDSSCIPGSCAITFASGSDWSSYSGTVAADGSTFTLTQLQGPAREVCLNTSDPPNCPAGALLYNVSYSSPAWTGGESIPSAHWIWRSDVALTSPGSMQVAIFQKTFAIGANATGSVYIAADDFAAVFVNNLAIGSVGSNSDVNAAESSHATGTMLDLTSALQSGTNVVTIAAQNGPWGCATTACPYSEDPAGVVFQGTLHW